MKRITLILALLTYSLNFAQTPAVAPQSISQFQQMVSSTENFNNNIKNNTNYFIKNGQKVENSNVIGSMYFNDEFKKGQVIDKESGQVISVYLRYRIYDDTFEAKKSPEEKETLIMERNPKYDIAIEDAKFTFINKLPIFINKANNGYLVVLNENKKGKLLKRISQDFIPGQKANTPMASDKKPRLKNEEHYFISLDEKIYAIEAHKKRAADAFPNHNKELEKYIKENKLKFRGDDEEKDLITLIKYYNEVTQDS
ncbi:hypothetical protein LX95_01363 [Mesonia algae]|uniref:Uncharacterized protein n=1 Tax=Mesonia algae TaxID=213248 RepID=A0A2W7I457_9FLAO|nr:hypothetical protein [Mesonia algae]PZW41681.1 hypothetical protein LX95_01363 [Mesonia algae]